MTTVPQDVLGDAALAVAAAAGDQLAFCAIYDRYADRLFDFCVGMLRDGDAAADCVQDVFVTAATKLGQLEDPDRLRAWLYAIARHQALARIRHRRREMPSDELPETASGDPDLASVAARHELADLIAEACGGLSDRDRTVYELAYRHGLDGPELAAALGVSHTNANTMVGRLRDGIERSLGALLVCRRVKADPSACPELAALLETWDGAFTVLMRKRIARHIDGCDVCEAERRRMVNPVALLGGVPVFLPAPAVLRDDTLATAKAGLPASGNDAAKVEEPWWPPSGIGQRPRFPAPAPSASQVRHVRAALVAALLVLGIAGVAQLSVPMNYRVEPASTPVDEPSPPSPPSAIFSIAGISPSATSDPVTTRAPATTTRPAPSFTATTEPDAPTLTTEPSRTGAPKTSPGNSFSPSRNSSTTTRTTESEEETSTRTSTTSTTSTSTSTSSATPTTPTTTTTTSDPIE